MTPQKFAERIRNATRNSWPLFIAVSLAYGHLKVAAIRQQQQNQADLIHDSLAPHIDAIRHEIKRQSEAQHG